MSHEVRAAIGSGRRVTVGRINRLLRKCSIVQESPISSLRQCSSSLFVLLFHRIFGVAVPDIELEPNTHEKKLYNMSRVLAALRDRGVDPNVLACIGAYEIVAQNEAHITRLMEVFLDIASSVWGSPSGSSEKSDPYGPAAGGALDVSHPDIVPTREEDISFDEDSQLHQNVATWRRGIVDPYGTRIQRSMNQLHRRIRRIDATIGGASVTGETGASLVRRQLALSNGLTDDRIERLRAKRLVAKAQQRILSATVNHISKKSVAMRAAAQSTLRSERNYYNDVRRISKEEERKRQEAYLLLIDSSLHDPQESMRYLRSIDGSEAVGKVVHEQRELRRLRQTLRAEEEGQQAMLSACLHRYEAALKRWRGMTGWDGIVTAVQ